MRTTIRLDDQLLTAAKQYAHETSKTLTAVIEDALREKFARRATAKQRKLVRLTTVGGQGVRRGIDLDDSASLLDIMEQTDASV